MRKCQFPNCFLAFARANSQIYEFPLETRQAKSPAVIDGLFAYFSYKKGACPDQRNKRPIALKYIKAFLAFVQYQKQNAGKMRRDAEKKDLVGPRQRRGLAEGIKPQAKDGGNLRLFFRRWDPPRLPAFIFILHFLRKRFIIEERNWRIYGWRRHTVSACYISAWRRTIRRKYYGR